MKILHSLLFASLLAVALSGCKKPITDSKSSADDSSSTATVNQSEEVTQDAASQDSDQDADSDQPKGKIESLLNAKEVVIAEGVIAKIQLAMAKGDYQAAAKLMTKDAARDYQLKMIDEVLSLHKTGFFKDEGFDKIDKQLAYLFSKHKMDQIKVPPLNSLADEEPTEKQILHQQILLEKMEQDIEKALNASADPWAIVKGIENTISGTPFELKIFSGKVASVEIAKDTMTMKLNYQAEAVAEKSDQVFTIDQPPMFLTFAKQNGKWTYTGIDHLKTDEALMEFSKQSVDTNSSIEKSVPLEH